MDLGERVAFVQGVAEQREDGHDPGDAVLPAELSDPLESRPARDPAFGVLVVHRPVARDPPTALSRGPDPPADQAEKRRAVQQAGAGPARLQPVCGAPGLGGGGVLAVVQDVAEEHDVGLVGEALVGQLHSVVDCPHPGEGEVHHLPGLPSAASERPREPLWVGVLELDAGPPGEGVPQGQQPARAGRLGQGALEIAVAPRVLLPQCPVVGVHRGVAGGTRLRQAEEAHHDLGEHEENGHAGEQKQDLASSTAGHRVHHMRGGKPESRRLALGELTVREQLFGLNLPGEV